MKLYDVLQEIVQEKSFQYDTDFKNDVELITEYLDGSRDIERLPKRLQEAVFEWENMGIGCEIDDDDPITPWNLTLED